MPPVKVDFEAEGLLKGLRGKAREARRRLLEELAADGVSLEELRQAVEDDRLVLLPVERVLGGGGRRYSPIEVAEIAGIEVEFLRRQRQALGLPPPDPDEKVLGEEDVESAKRLKQFLDAGLPEEAIRETGRVLGLAMSQVAAANRAAIAEALVREGDTEYDLAHRLTEVARNLAPMQGRLMEFAYNLHLREQIRHDVIGRAQVRAGATGAQEVAASFADMVGFTRLGEELPPEELGRVTGRLWQLAGDLTSPPVRLVKMIGDAAMLVSPEPEPVLDASLALIDAAEDEGEDFPILRAGVAWGTALPRAGDWYGRPINLASRITGIARPGSVLCDEEVREAVADDRYRWSFARARRLKGIEGEVKLFRVRAADSDQKS
jgi:adenylate cyclase